MADVYVIDVRVRVTVASHDTAMACRRELREVVETALAPLADETAAFRMGAIDSVCEFVVKTRQVE